MNFAKLMVITDHACMKPNWDSAILAACLGGAKWICVREKQVAPRELLALTLKAVRIGEKFGARVFINGRADIARAVHAEGLHLPETEIDVESARVTLGFHTPIGVSVHDLAGAQRAQTEGANYLLFGPVFPTQSHPDAPPAGLEKLSEVAQGVSIPVFAVGGIKATNAEQCLQAGARGVAVISGVWDGDITANVRALRTALGEQDAPLHGHGAVSDTPPIASGSPLAATLKNDKTS